MTAQLDTLRAEVIALLSRHAPLTSAEIAREIGKPYASVRRAIAAARTGNRRVFYVAGYDEVAGSGYKRPSMYALGDKKDRPYPHLGMNQKYKRRWEREKTKSRIAGLGASNPFASLIAQVTA